MVRRISEKNDQIKFVQNISLIFVFLLMVILCTTSFSSAAATGNTSSISTNTHQASYSNEIASSPSKSANFTITNEFRDAGSDTYPNPGKVVTKANYTSWVWTNIVIKNNGPDDSNITIKDQGLGFVFYNTKIGWNGWVRINDGTGWKKDNNFDFKTGTGTYWITNGSTLQIAILGYVNQTGTIKNEVKEISQDTNGPNIYPSATKTLNVPDAAIIRLKGEFRSSLNGSPIKNAVYKDWIYSVTKATNQGPNKANVKFKITTSGLTSNGTYALSRDNGLTWIFNDSSYDPETKIWNINIPSNTTWLLAIYAKVTSSGNLNSTVSQLSQDVYNPYGSDNSKPKCLIVFDDGNEAQYSIAYQYMQSKGIIGTLYINGYNIGTDGVLSVKELQEMSDAGWIIGNHAYEHVDLSSLTKEEVSKVISEGINYLKSIGLSDGAYNLAYPGGYYSEDAFDVMQKLGVLTGRTTVGQLIYSLNGLNLYLIPSYTILNSTSVSSVKGYVDSAIQSGSTIVLLFHNIATQSNDEYVYTSDNFKEIIDYIQSTGIECLNINQLYSQSTDIPVSIPPNDLDLTTFIPGTDSGQTFDITSNLYVPAPIADVEIKINSSNLHPHYGENVTLTIQVKNNGPNSAENVTVGEWFNENYFKYISDNGNGKFDPNTAIWNVGDLDNGVTKILKIVVQIVAQDGTISNIATYNSGDTEDSNLTNNYQKWV